MEDYRKGKVLREYTCQNPKRHVPHYTELQRMSVFAMNPDRFRNVGGKHDKLKSVGSHIELLQIDALCCL